MINLNGKFSKLESIGESESFGRGFYDIVESNQKGYIRTTTVHPNAGEISSSICFEKKYEAKKRNSGRSLPIGWAVIY